MKPTMHTSPGRLLRATLSGLLLLATPLLAQDNPPASSPAASAVSMEEAYRKEFAFLSAQKRELESRLRQMQAEGQRQESTLTAEIGRLEQRVLALGNEAERLQEQAALAGEAASVNAENRELLQATFAQAEATLESLRVEAIRAPDYAGLGDAERTARLFALAQARLGELGRVRSEPGRFFLADGTQVEGTIVRLGNIAAFGVSEKGSGALAPAGGGELRLWSQPAADVAEALAKGQQPPVLRAFLIENLNAAVSEPERKTLMNEVRKGGPIGYTILLLGLVAMLLALLRAIFLGQAGSSIQSILDAVTPLVRQHRIAEAIEACKRFKGSAARVVTAALRNVDREREHLEDIISESILHESTRLNRFGAVILMIAAVAPLMGLLGTVTGMIQTFDVITEFGTSDPKLLSGGIAVALVTTELGLIVAIPCLLIGNLLGGWAERIKDDMEKAALKVVNLLAEPKQAKAA